MKWAPVVPANFQFDERWVVFRTLEGGIVAGRSEFHDGCFYDLNGVYVGDVTRGDFTHYIELEQP